MTDDQSILGSVIVYRRIQSVYFDYDASGHPVLSHGAFRTQALSVFRCDRVSELEMLNNGKPEDGLVQISIGAIRNTGCIVEYDEPPMGHICAYNKVAPGSRISKSSAAEMTQKVKWIKFPKKP
jgi:hypothetical protein